MKTALQARGQSRLEGKEPKKSRLAEQSEKVYPEQSERVKLPETDDGTILFRVPFPDDLKELHNMSPIVVKQPYHIDYIHSYGQDSPFFAGLSNGKLLGTKCPDCGYAYATPKGHCGECGARCDWVELPKVGRIHTFTVCQFGSEEFLKETPYMLILVEFEKFNTLFLSRLIGFDPKKASLDLVGMKVRPQFKRNAKFKPTDVYFVPAE
ncbi:MAG: Zn-ribbon domain-containing OB-fold protein [Planctomycetes bacterium]|nr:Zn-ribbon domain-containing OB-fold protein [Planctomycetota bacterium]